MAEIFSDLWSEFAQDNDANYPDGWQGGTTFPHIPPIGREMMAAIKREYNRSHPTLTTSGDGDLVTLTPITALTEYVDGQIFAAKLNASLGAAGTATRTLNISGLGGKKIYIQDLASGFRQTVQSGGEAKAGQGVFFRYDATLDSGAGGFVIFSYLPRIAPTESIEFALTGENSAPVALSSSFLFRLPFPFTFTGASASLKVAQTSGSVVRMELLGATVPFSGISVISGLIIDNGETTSLTAASQPTIHVSAQGATIAADSQFLARVTVVGDGTARGLKMALLGYQR